VFVLSRQKANGANSVNTNSIITNSVVTIILKLLEKKLSFKAFENESREKHSRLKNRALNANAFSRANGFQRCARFSVFRELNELRKALATLPRQARLRYSRTLRGLESSFQRKSLPALLKKPTTLRQERCKTRKTSNSFHQFQQTLALSCALLESNARKKSFYPHAFRKTV